MDICKSSITSGTIEKWIMVFILIVVLFNIVAAMYPEATTAGDSLNASGIPLGTFFASGGALWYLVAAALLFLVFKSFSGGAKK